MDEQTYRDARIMARLQEMVLLQVDVTENTAEDQALLKHFGLVGPPGIVFFDMQGKEIRGLRVTGYQSADALLPMVDQVLNPTTANKLTITRAEESTRPPTNF